MSDCTFLCTKNSDNWILLWTHFHVSAGLSGQACCSSLKVYMKVTIEQQNIKSQWTVCEHTESDY